MLVTTSSDILPVVSADSTSIKEATTHYKKKNLPRATLLAAVVSTGLLLLTAVLVVDLGRLGRRTDDASGTRTQTRTRTHTASVRSLSLPASDIAGLSWWKTPPVTAAAAAATSTLSVDQKRRLGNDDEDDKKDEDQPNRTDEDDRERYDYYQNGDGNGSNNNDDDDDDDDDDDAEKWHPDKGDVDCDEYWRRRNYTLSPGGGGGNGYRGGGDGGQRYVSRLVYYREGRVGYILLCCCDRDWKYEMMGISFQTDSFELTEFSFSLVLPISANNLPLFRSVPFRSVFPSSLQ